MRILSIHTDGKIRTPILKSQYFPKKQTSQLTCELLYHTFKLRLKEDTNPNSNKIKDAIKKAGSKINEFFLEGEMDAFFFKIEILV